VLSAWGFLSTVTKRPAAATATLASKGVGKAFSSRELTYKSLNKQEVWLLAELDNAIARLRMFLAEVAAKEKQLDAMARQFRQQLSRASQRALYAHMPLEASLSVMGEIEERLAGAEVERKHLNAIKRRAQVELEAVQVTKRVEEAKQTLADLQARAQGASQQDQETLAEIHALEQFINEYSQRAGRAITDIARERASQTGSG